MKKKDIITKWLDHEPLTTEESEAFKNLEAFDSYIKISETAKKIKSPEFDIQNNLTTLQGILKNREQKKTSRPSGSLLFKIAAVFVIALGVGSFFMLLNNATTISTEVSEKTMAKLPDQSSVMLNTLSSITYQDKDWKNNRNITLTGEAYFKVTKGNTFDVHTADGIVSVLGTQFNVKHRDNYFEVTCYEGLVSVTYKGESIKLPAGNFIRVIEGNIINKQTSLLKPNWTGDKSAFASTPYKYVLEEFERQYNVIIITKNLDLNTLFTGNFVHSNLQTALQSISIPMRLKYEMNGNNITLYKQ